MDANTVKSYDAHAEELTDKYESAELAEMHQLLLRYLPKNGELLEIGCGSGRDAAFLLGESYRITPVDPSESMLRQAATRHPELVSLLMPKSFPLSQDDALMIRHFDGILCLAVLMHIPNHDLFEFARQNALLLKSGGILILSFSTGRQVTGDDRDSSGRLYIERPAEQIQLLFDRLGFRLLTRQTQDDVLGRNIKWHYLVMQKTAETTGSRSVDQIESVISHDKKTATYKLALLRALCAIAQTEANAVEWGTDGFIRVPLGLIAEKWLFYYWPLVVLDGESQIEIPQTRGKEMAFRKHLQRLIYAYGAGGLNAAYADYKSGRVPHEILNLLDITLNSIANTIVVGPVTYTGGGHNPYFRFDGRKTARKRCVNPISTCSRLGHVLVPVAMWQEMCLIGHWIGESLILRWGELTYEISKKKVSREKVIEKLLVTPQPDRDVALARQIFAQTTDIKCVWTNAPLSNGWHVDHALPYSIWHNNDLWNLFPSTKVANSQKSDKIVTARLLYKCRENIIQCWELFKSAAEERFSVELSRSLLHDQSMTNWQIRAFNGLVENVETVATQRGCDRWDGLHRVASRSRPAASTTLHRFFSFSEIEDSAFKTALPYVGDLAAGQWSNGFFFSSLDECHSAQWLKVPEKLGGKNRFIVVVAGDSMEPTFSRGELLIFEYHRTPRQDGQVVVALLVDNADDSEPQVAIKRIRQDRYNWRIISDNPAFSEQTVSKNECRYPILGTYVGKISSTSS